MSLSVAAVIGAVLVMPSPSYAAMIREGFESQTVGTSTLPGGWTLITEAGSPTYQNVAGSDGSGGNSGVAGQVSSTAYTGDTDLPGAYIVNSTTFDPRQTITGSFEVNVPQEDIYDDAVFIFGDIGGGLTRQAADALSLKIYEGTGSYTVLTDGAGGELDNTPNISIQDDTWYRLDFSWTPTSGSTGDFEVDIVTLGSNTLLGTLSTSGFTFAPSSVQFGFGSVNDTGIFDNINIGVPEPSAFLLGALSLLSLGLTGRRQRRRASFDRRNATTDTTHVLLP